MSRYRLTKPRKMRLAVNYLVESSAQIDWFAKKITESNEFRQHVADTMMKIFSLSDRECDDAIQLYLDREDFIEKNQD